MRRRYWDADCFLAWLNGEEPKATRCQPVIRLAEANELEIVTSDLTLAEVLFLRRPDLPKEAQMRQIEDFFQLDYIIPVQVDRETVLEGRRLVWDRGIAPKDAIHVASALRADVEHFDTFDQELIARAAGYPLPVGEPDIPEQMTLGDE